ncbi:DUF262 domain-containing protein [Prevotella sp. oral taxon 475]|uniref:GmrSD restriction endonuclease domain-containing protein n=1 Tax=Prevotella sp. oral taxon 475 TaxID=712471 RepID=UPI001BA667A8|nr:DUF262 domain-containing protein [Prevotella sp. oral taxon 475]QUB48033.1 DUF262 domain-containing protein [Prevotella sp. oral taxon 475]
MIGNRTYYGEYSLERWIELVVKGNIVLPEYQRHFVWDQKDLKRLIKSLHEGQFVQPVTIGLYNKGNKEKINLLLDGQQRLSSILLAYLGYFPKKEMFETPNQEIAIEDDSAFDEAGDNQNTEIKSIKWTIRELYDKEKSLEELRAELSSNSRYEKLDLGLQLEEDFWKETFIGFSFIVPDMAEVSDVQTFYTHLFRNMNYYGRKLSASESRKSLYYQDSRLTNYFEGKTEQGDDVLCDLKVKQDFKPRQIDFIRYLSMLSQKKVGKTVMMGYSAYNSRENYYADYVAYLLGLEQEEREDKFDGFDFSAIFPDYVIRDRYNKLREGVEQIKQYIHQDYDGAFKSWIDADLWLLGLIYYVVFEGKDLSLEGNKGEDLRQAISEEIDSKNEAYQKRSNALGHIRERINKSIEIYNDYVS